MALDSRSSHLSLIDSQSTLNSLRDFVSDAELLKASLEYMRTPSPGLHEAGNTSQYWIIDSASAILQSNSSPVLSCPPSWLHDEHGSSDSLETENDEELFPSEVPLSSSPPDLTSSSPQSGSSDASDEISSSLASSSDGSLKDSVAVSQPNSSFVDLSTAADLAFNDFGERLHQLLLIAMKEREHAERESASEHHGTDSLSDGEFSDCGYDSSDNSSGLCGVLDEELKENNQDTVVERTCPRTHPKCFDGEDQFESPSLSLSNSLKDISPICFKTETVSESPETTKYDNSKAYRLIKRSQSYAPTEDKDEPLIKRQKIARDHGSHATDRIYAHRTASLRRADSLRSAPANSSPIAKDWIATVPATPVPATPKPSGAIRVKTSECSNVSTYPVPIIAPPEDHVAKLPLSPETMAKIRLTRYLEREARRQEDWPPLPDRSICKGNSPSEWENVLDIGRERREAAINWLLDVLPSKTPGRVSSSVSSCSSLSSVASESSCTSSSSKSSSFQSSGGSSSCSTTNTPEDNASNSFRSNLEDQLENSPETRFHAAWMFLSYFYLTMPSISSSNKSRSSSKESTVSIDEEGLNLLVWDIAVACLAISVKFHRDFLDPLLPVFAYEYVALAPHDIAHEDLESAHRDVLSAFDYQLGVTPQPVMDELWSALTSLRGLLGFDGGWKDAMTDAWTRLFIALDEPDVQRFRVSVLTVVALMDGILESLIDNYCRAAVRRIKPKPSAEDHYRNMRLLRTKFSVKAKDEAEGVFCDIQALTGITDV